jgi:hypothetical protein
MSWKSLCGEMADATDSKSVTCCKCAGSSPARGTKNLNFTFLYMFKKIFLILLTTLSITACDNKKTSTDKEEATTNQVMPESQKTQDENLQKPEENSTASN